MTVRDSNVHSHPGHPAHPAHTAHLAHPAQRPPSPPSSPSPPSPLSSPSPLSPLSPGHQSTCGIFVCRGRGTECSERLISSKSVVHCFTQCTGSFFFSGWCFCSFCCLFGLTDHRRFDDCQSLERAQKKLMFLNSIDKTQIAWTLVAEGHAKSSLCSSLLNGKNTDAVAHFVTGARICSRRLRRFKLFGFRLDESCKSYL